MRLILFLLFMPSLALAGYVPAYTVVSETQDFEVYANSAYKLTHERTIRIDTPQGIDLYGQAQILYDGKRDDLAIIDAYTIKPNGERVVVSPDRVKRVTVSADDIAPYFTDQMMAVIIFPQVEVGSMLYYKTLLLEESPPIKGRFADITPFSPHIKYEDSTIRLVHPADMQMNVYSRGLRGEKNVLADGRVQHHYSYRQDTAYPVEPKELLYEDFSPVLQFSNYNGYKDLAQITQSLFQAKTQVTPLIYKLANEISQGSKTRIEKAQKIYNWVSNNIRYVGIDVGASGFEPHFADEIASNLYGDCKDHAVIMEALLKAVGIDSSPVLIKTDLSYSLPHLPGNYYFDHAITYVPELDLYLDSTAQFADFGTLPTGDMGKPTLIVQSGQVGLTPQTSNKIDYAVTYTKMRVMPNGSIIGTATYEPHGAFVPHSRTKQFGNENRDTQTVVDSLLHRFHETGTGQIDHGDPTDLSKRWFVSSKFNLDPVINLPGPSAFTVPTGIAPGFIRLFASTKPFVNRRFPFECGSSKYIENIELIFPADLHISRVPQNASKTTDGLTYQSMYKISGNKLFIKRLLSSHVKSDFCSPNLASEKSRVNAVEYIRRDLRSQIFVE